MSLKGIIWTIVIILVVGGLLTLSRTLSPDHSTGDLEVLPASAVKTILDRDQTKGDKGATVTLIEYSDFQCPACGNYFPILKELTREFGDNLHFVYRHFPLRNIHPHAQLAGQAAEAAGLQGKFWEMHDLLFERQISWSQAFGVKKKFVEYAEGLGLDKEQFEKDIDSDAVAQKVNNDYESAVSFGLNSTPSFLLNGERIHNPSTYEEFRSVILQELGTKKIEAPDTE